MNIAEAELESFLAAAAELKIRGLSQPGQNQNQNQNQNHGDESQHVVRRKKLSNGSPLKEKNLRLTEGCPNSAVIQGASDTLTHFIESSSRAWTLISLSI